MAVGLPEEEGFRRGTTRRAATPTTRVNNARRNQALSSQAVQMARAGTQRGIPYSYSGALSTARANLAGRLNPAPSTAPATKPYSPNTSGGGGGGGGGRGGYGYGGGGGGGGGGAAAGNPQGGLDMIMQLLRSGQYTAQPDTAAMTALQGLRGNVNSAAETDTASLGQTFGGLYSWLAQNRSNPYDNLQFQQSQVAKDYNPYLATQGVDGLNAVTQNPDDSYGGFKNAAALGGANFNSGVTSREAEGRAAEAYGRTGIDAARNAYLANIGGQEVQLAQEQTKRQDTLSAEKRTLIAQLVELINAGAKAPDLTGII
jgi:hypothetical protein